MIIHNLKLAYRGIAKNKLISAINILGLAFGLMSVIFIYQYIWFEKSYDKFFDNSDRIQRLVFYRYYQTGLDKSVGNNYYVGEIAASKIPEIENFCRVKKETLFFQLGDELIKEERSLYADSSFFDMFSHEVLLGNKTEFLRQPDVVIISESTARKYFGDENPIGRIIILADPSKKVLTVQGVIKDVPANSHLKFDLLVSFSTITNESYCYSCNHTNTYFLLRKGSNSVEISEKVTLLAKENFMSRDVGLDYPIEFHLQAVTDIHLNSNYRYEFETNGNSKYLTILAVIVLIILLCAGFNFFNLYSTLTGKRIGGIGIRIINGASGRRIISEIITETLLTGIISLVIAFVFLFQSFPFLKDFLSLEFTLESIFHIRIWLLPSLIVLIISILTGLFLGLKIYNVAPVSFINKDINLITKKQSRRFLLTGQFVVAIVLIGCTMGVIKQINYMEKEAFTMNIDQTIVVKRPTTREFNNSQKIFQEALLMYPGISNITFSTIRPGEKNNWVKGGLTLKGKEDEGHQFFQSSIAPNFFNFFEVELLAGRQFFKDETNWEGGPKHLILNKEAALIFGEDKLEDIIGQTLYDNDTKQDMGEIVGIIDGYFQNSLDQEINPTIFNCDQLGYYIFIRIDNADVMGMVEKITSEFHTSFKDQYFEYYFLDNYFNLQYKNYIQLFRCFILFSLIAIIITCLSLFGLVLMANAARTKEIGIRKVIGAKVSEILFLINREFIILISIAFIISVPVIWFALHKWLQSFAYKTEISWWLFVLAGLCAFVIVFLTVIWKSWKTATMNPVKALRYE